MNMKPSDSISFFLPLGLLILSLLFVSSVAHTPPAPADNKQKQCLCPCPCSEATSPPAQNQSHKVTSPPGQNQHKESHEATSPPTNNENKKSNNVIPPPTQNQHKESHGATSPPGQNQHKESHEATSPPTNNENKKSNSVISPPTQNQHKESHEATSPPTNTENKKTNNVTSPPTQNQHKESHEATSPPANNEHDKSHEVTSPPAQNQDKKSYEASSPPAQTEYNKSHEVTSTPGQNNGNVGFTLHGSYKGCFAQLFAFGESYTDRGNAFLLENNASSSANQQNQFCDGRLLVDFLCDTLGLPTLPPYKATSANFAFGANFAIAGSTALPSSFFPKLKISSSFWTQTPTESFQTQIDWFYKFKGQMGCKDEDSCKAKMANALFWIGELGVDDYARTHGLKLSLRWLAENSVANVARILQALLDSGARYIVVQGLPPVGCLPIDITACPLHLRDLRGCAPAANAAIMVHNEILQGELKRFQALYPHCSILYADYWNAYLTILANPAKYQFEEPFKACCGAGGDLNFNVHSPCGSPGTSKCKDPSKYINWDGIHFTQAMHKQITNLFINEGFCQPSFAEMIKHKKGMSDYRKQ